MPGPGGRSVGRVNVRVAPDTSSFRVDLQRSLERLERTLTVNIPTRIDARRITADAIRIKRDLERQLADVSVGMDLRGAAQAQAELARVARDRTAEVRVAVDRPSLARAQSALSRLGDALSGLRGDGGGDPERRWEIAGLSSLAIAASAAVVPVVQVGAALAPLAGALAALPAVASSAGAAMATMRVATLGVGDAITAAAEGNAEKLAEALERLSPAARSFVGEVQALTPAFRNLQQSVQDAFFAQFAGDLTEISARLLPSLQRGMVDVADAMGGAASELAEFASSAQAVQFIDQTFASTATAIRNAEGALPAFLSGLAAIGTAGLPYVERLWAALDNAAERFRDWATTAAESGRVTEWIDGAITAFSQLGSIAGNVAGILGAIFEAAGDGGILATLDQLTGGLDDFLASAEGMSALEGIFQGLTDLGSALTPVLGALVMGVGTLAPIVGRLAEALGPVLTSAINGLVPALAELEPGLTALINGLGEGIDALVSTGALQLVGEALSAIMVALAPLLPALGELVGVLAGALAEALIAIAPSLQLVAETLADSLTPAMPELSAGFTELVEAIAPLIPQLVQALLPVLQVLPELLLLTAEQSRSWARIITILTPAIELLVAGLALVVTGLSAVISWIVRAVTRLYSLQRSAQRVGTAIGTAIGRMHNRIVAAVSGAIQYLVSLPGRIMSAFSRARSWLVNAGLNLIYGLMDGINRAIGALWRQISSIAQSVRDFWPFSPARRGPLRTHPMDQAGRNLAAMLADGMAQGESLVASAASRLAGAAVLPDIAGEATLSASTERAAGQADRLGALVAAVEALAGRDVVLVVDSQEIARATERGQRQLARR
ncbi:phage tail protein [Marinactinospora rubrisoli]|uniref:Phage-related protein n=1 Tax=Marinactinospora rubrisoli TaxID=2715399 RepID=A0ABW2KLW5_9ACTN